MAAVVLRDKIPWGAGESKCKDFFWKKKISPCVSKAYGNLPLFTCWGTGANVKSVLLKGTQLKFP